MVSLYVFFGIWTKILLWDWIRGSFPQWNCVLSLGQWWMKSSSQYAILLAMINIPLMRRLGRIWYTDIIVLRGMAKFTSRQIIALLKNISERKISVGNKQGERSECSRGTTTDFGESSLKFRQIFRSLIVQSKHSTSNSKVVTSACSLVWFIRTSFT